MTRMPHEVWPDSTLSLLRDPYRFISRHCHAHQSDVFQARVLLEKTICMTGREAAELFYDNERFVRHGAMPSPVMKTLFGVGGIQGLDGDRHRRRKQMFMSLMEPLSVARIADTFADYLTLYSRRWSSMNQVVIYDELQEILTRTACDWAGVPLPDTERPRRTAQLTALFDHAGSKGPKHWGARLARHRAEDWTAALVEEIRAGRVKPPSGSAAVVIAGYRDTEDSLLDAHTAAVELLNVLRPIVAISVYITFIVLALHHFPDRRTRLLLENDEDYALGFVQEVRRYYPFFPMLAARVRDDFLWHNYSFPKGRRVLLDLFGTNHDVRCWDDPDVFRPERFLQARQNDFAFIPQGGGDYYRHHRCPGESIVTSLMQRALDFFSRRLQYQVPAQDLRVNYRRMPALPRSRLVIGNPQVVESGTVDIATFQ